MQVHFIRVDKLRVGDTAELTCILAAIVVIHRSRCILRLLPSKQIRQVVVRELGRLWLFNLALGLLINIFCLKFRNHFGGSCLSVALHRKLALDIALLLPI